MRQGIDDTAGEEPAIKPKRRRTVVITDGGDHVGLALLDPEVKAAAGSRFDHQGRTWVVRGCRHHSRVLVAEPLDSGGH